MMMYHKANISLTSLTNCITYFEAKGLYIGPSAHLWTELSLEFLRITFGIQPHNQAKLDTVPEMQGKWTRAFLALVVTGSLYAKLFLGHTKTANFGNALNFTRA
ncbi:hypothetical protein SE23_14560 [Vibrio sinaloensis]|nr:hypothetical protein SE23_14560 [Vibrio sinaloensis]